MSTRLHIIVPDGLVARVDAARGDVSRSRWIMRAVEEALEGSPRSPELVAKLKENWDSSGLIRQFTDQEPPVWVEPPPLSDEQREQVGRPVSRADAFRQRRVQ